MSTDTVDAGRRRVLTVATSVVGGVGTAFVAVPFLASWAPSEKARAAGAPVEADISKLEPGQLIRVEWRGKPVWIVRRTKAQLASLDSVATKLNDPESNDPQQPDYAKNAHRSVKEEYLVLVGLCTHLGCSPTYTPQQGAISPDWEGGFFCPCHGSKFDMAGRVFSGVPAQQNMVVPKHTFLNDSLILIGEDGEAA
jgi:ubiquinol-cytochrome c reductase iron-sulfur subunit